MEIAQEAMAHLTQLGAEIDGAIRTFPDELWRRPAKGENPLGTPCFLAHHTVWCMVLEHLLRIPAEELPHNVYPDYGPDMEITQENLLALHGEIQAYAAKVYGKMSNEDYLTVDERGMSPIGRIMYTIAHTRHHYGQLVQILRDNGLEDPDWYPLR